MAQQKTVLRVPVTRMGGGYIKALLPEGETVFGIDEREVAERLKVRTHVLRARTVRKA